MTLPENRFDYSALDPVTADFLKNKEISMSEIVGRAYTEIGRELSEARETLAQHGYGCFEEWYTTLGFKKDQVYRWIGRHELIVANCEKRELIEQLPVSLTYEISKPSANPEAIKAVLDGDINTHKEFKELEKSLKEAKKSAAEAEQRARQAEMDKQAAIAQKFTLVKQIEELKSTTNRSPEDELKLRELVEENQRLSQANRKMENELLERNTSIETTHTNLRKMKESLNKTRAYVDVDLSSALMYFSSISDHREAQEYAEKFWSELDETISRNRAKWNQALQKPIIEEVGEDAGRVIDIG